MGFGIVFIGSYSGGDLQTRSHWRAESRKLSVDVILIIISHWLIVCIVGWSRSRSDTVESTVLIHPSSSDRIRLYFTTDTLYTPNKINSSRSLLVVLFINYHIILEKFIFIRIWENGPNLGLPNAFSVRDPLIIKMARHGASCGNSYRKHWDWNTWSVSVWKSPVMRHDSYPFSFECSSDSENKIAKIKFNPEWLILELFRWRRFSEFGYFSIELMTHLEHNEENFTFLI